MKRMFRYFFILALTFIAFNAEAQTEYVTKSDARVRKGAGAKYKSLGLIKAGERVIVYDTSNPYWYQIVYKTKPGFLSSKSLNRVEISRAEQKTTQEEGVITNLPGTTKANSSTPYIAIAVIIVILLFVIASSKNKKEKIESRHQPALRQPSPVIKEMIPKNTLSIADRNKTLDIGSMQSITNIEPVNTGFMVKQNDEPGQEPVSQGIDNNADEISQAEIDIQDKEIKNITDKESVIPEKNIQSTVSKTAIAETIKAGLPVAGNRSKGIEDMESGENLSKTGTIKPNMTVNDFRVWFKELTDLLPESIAKDALVNFQKLDLSYIDLAKARFELLGYQVKEDKQHYFASINQGGEIAWAKMQPGFEPELLIGQPVVRADYYSNIIELVGKLLSKPDKKSIKDDSVIDVTSEKYVLPDLRNSPLPVTFHETSFSYQAPYWGLGTKYKAKLKLADDEVKILDALIDTDNKFNSIEYVAIELIRLFLDLLHHLKEEFSRSGTSMEEQTNKIAEIELTQRYKLWKNSSSYMTQLPGFSNSVKQVIYKIGENSLRDHFGVGRKTDLKNYLFTEDALAEFNERFYKLIEYYIANHLTGIKACDEQTEVQLNEYSKSRWKSKLEVIKANGEKSGYTGFYDQVLAMGIQNKNNPSVENIFFDASKFIAKADKVAALKLYAHYVYYDLQSATFDNKQLNKTIQKSLFNNDLQLREFELVINKLIEDKDIEKAITSIPDIYTTKRKKIQLDASKIKEVQEKHSDTVELLNEYLKDEERAASEFDSAGTIEVELVISPGIVIETSSIYKESQRLSEIQVETLNLFSKRGFTLSINEFDIFVKSRGVFKNSLLDSINEIYFDLLDDVLIEEDEEAITLTETYYSKIIN